jgi:uncharacterized protein (TIGR02284 family)
MSNDNLDKTIDVLNDLIETSKDGEAGFLSCAEDVKSLELKSLFNERARECAAAAKELQTMVLGLGGDPEDDTSVSGDLHRRWVDFKAMVTGQDEKAVLNECERGEDVAKKRYSEALENELPLNVRELVKHQYANVLRNHDQIKALRNNAGMRG